MLNIRFPKVRKPGLMRHEKGFTLIEVLIAIAFFMAIVGGILTAMGSSSKILATANNKEIAKDIAAGDMEYIRTLPYASNYFLLMSSSSSSTYGNPVTFIAIITPSTTTGTVTFKDGATAIGTGTLSGGQATFTTSTLVQGSHNITAVYSTMTSSVLNQMVSPSSPTTPLPPQINSKFVSSINVTFLRTKEQQIDIKILLGGIELLSITDYRVSY